MTAPETGDYPQWLAYDALCIHGPGSPDRCGHPDCVGARHTRPAPDLLAALESSIEEARAARAARATQAEQSGSSGADHG